MAPSRPYISTVCGRCSQRFEELSALAKDHSSSLVSSSNCLDELARFRIWANNIGALLNPEQRNSLDYRLRSSPKVYERVIEILEDLVEGLEDGQITIINACLPVTDLYQPILFSRVRDLIGIHSPQTESLQTALAIGNVMLYLFCAFVSKFRPLHPQDFA